MSRVVVLDYDPIWSVKFLEFKLMYEKTLGNLIISIEHIGSTSIKDLAAKPIIDIVIVIDFNKFSYVKEKLELLHYYHNGDQGIKGREAFRLPENEIDNFYPHHLYVCDKNTNELQRYYAFRSYLRSNKLARDEYSSIKKNAARLFPDDIEKYMDHKGHFIAIHLTKALKQWGYQPDHDIKNCPKCDSLDFVSEFEIKYDKGGLKEENYYFICHDCEYKWTIIID